MSSRKVLLVTGETYHIFNKSAHKLPIFKTDRDYSIFIEAMSYYIQSLPPIKFSIYRRGKKRYELVNDRLVTILNYCLMPNHFHFTLRQEEENGIKNFIQKLTGSYAHYFNKKYETNGSIFTGNFKAVRIEDDEQLLHLSRYIHLNPVTSYLVQKPEDYRYSSYNMYLKNKKSDLVDTSIIMEMTNTKDYEKFALNQVDYQRELRNIKHLILE